MSFFYFAYGSNMLPARLTAQSRCPSAKVIGLASAPNHALEFTKPSKDDSGKATIVSAEDYSTPGVIFEIAKTDLGKLDRAEGAGYGYDRRNDFAVRLVTTDETVTATTYIASRTEAHLKPYDWYLALILAGARHHELDAGHTRMLSEIEYVIDSDLTRDGRTDALTALAAHGFNDHHLLLNGT